MDNEILRVSGNERTYDADINVSSFGGNAVTHKAVEEEHNIIGFLTEELNEKQINAKEERIAVDKPKLFEPVALAILQVVITAILALVCYIVGSLYIVPPLLVLTSISVPLTMMFFLYRLNTRKDVTFFTIAKLMLVGAFIHIVISYAFDILSTNFFGASFVITAIKCAFELICCAVVTLITVNSSKNNNYMSVLVIAGSVAAGFVVSRISIDLFNTLFIRTQVNNGSVIEYMGAIINNAELGKESVRNIVVSVFYVGFFKPLIFMFLTISNGFALKFISVKNKFTSISNVMGGFIYPLTIVLYSLSEFLSTISFLQIIYNVLALGFSLYAFIGVVEYCIKTELYKK